MHNKSKDSKLQSFDRILGASKGPCTYDVRTDGGRGGSRIAQFCGRTVLIGCVKCGQGEGGGLKSRKFRGRHMYMAPINTRMKITRR